MNFYQHHIGDFNNATRHLTRVERSIYRDLIELYYDTEAPLMLDLDRLARRVLVGDEDRSALQDILDEFFICTDDGWHNKRCDEEIAKYRDKQSKAKASAQASVAARSTSVQRPLNERSTNAEPPQNGRRADVELTKNQEPIKRQPPHPPAGGGQFPGFALFWDSYPNNPRKVAKRQCFDKWRSRGLEPMAKAVVSHVKTMAQSEKWLEQRGKFVPAPLVYLNQDRWEAPTEAEDATPPSQAANHTADYLAKEAEHARLVAAQRAARRSSNNQEATA